MNLSPRKQELFEAKFDRSDGCWIWKLGLNGAGYGSFAVGGGRVFGAHRVAYMVHYGDIPAGQVVMHTCDERACVNPAHLMAGTQSDNMADMKRKGRSGDKGRKLSDQQVEEVQALARMNVTYSEIAERYGVSQAVVRKLLLGRSYGVEPEDDALILAKRRKGQSNAKLDESKVREIRALLAGGVPNKDVATQFQISRSVISLIRHGHIWKEVS